MKHDWSNPARADIPTAGFYRTKLVRNGPWCGVRIWHGAPPDPDNPGQLLDRSHRWQAEVNGQEWDVWRLWPFVAGRPIEEAEYRYLAALSGHAKTWDESLPEAKPTQPIDPLRVAPPF